MSGFGSQRSPGTAVSCGPPGRTAAPAVDDYDWESLRGGGFAALDPADGKTVISGRLPDDVAWGTGGVAVAPFGAMLAVADRTGCLHLVDPYAGTIRRSTPALASTSLGIAHLAVVGRRGVVRVQPGRVPASLLCGAAAAADGP